METTPQTEAPEDVGVTTRLGIPIIEAVDKEIERLRGLGLKSNRSDVIRRALAKYFGWTA